MQKQHDLADHLLLGPAGNDPFGTLWADPSHFAQAARLLLDDIEHGITEGPHQLSGVDRPDPADHPGAEIFLDPLGRRRRGRLKEQSSELDAMGPVVDPASTRLHELAGRHHRGMAEYGDQVALAAGFDTQHAKPVLSVVEGDALDNTGQGLDRRARLYCRRHRVIMKPSIPRCYRDRPPGRVRRCTRPKKKEPGPP